MAGLWDATVANELYEFRDRVQPLLGDLNQQVIQTAITEGHTDGWCGALDGTTVAANATRHRMVNLETVEKRLEILDQKIGQEERGEDVIPEIEAPEPEGSESVNQPFLRDSWPEGSRSMTSTKPFETDAPRCWNPVSGARLLAPGAPSGRFRDHVNPVFPLFFPSSHAFATAAAVRPCATHCGPTRATARPPAPSPAHAPPTVPDLADARTHSHIRL